MPNRGNGLRLKSQRTLSPAVGAAGAMLLAPVPNARVRRAFCTTFRSGINESAINSVRVSPGTVTGVSPWIGGLLPAAADALLPGAANDLIDSATAIRLICQHVRGNRSPVSWPLACRFAPQTATASPDNLGLWSTPR